MSARGSVNASSRPRPPVHLRFPRVPPAPLSREAPSSRMRAVPYIVPFPSGIPFLSGSYGISVHERGRGFKPLVSADWDLWFVAGGEAHWHFAGGESLRLKTNRFYLLPPGLAIQRGPVRSRLILWFCHFAFTPIPAKFFVSLRPDYMEFEEPKYIPFTFSKEEAPRIWRAYRDFLAIDLDPDGRATKDRCISRPAFRGKPWQKERALLQLLAEMGHFALMRDLREEDGRILSDCSHGDSRITGICQQIREQPALAWSRPATARSIGVSVRHLDRLSILATGRNFHAYVVETRLWHAVRLLKESGPEAGALSVKEISALSGFDTPDFFRRHFKKFFGITPRDYQRLPERPLQPA